MHICKNIKKRNIFNIKCLCAFKNRIWLYHSVSHTPLGLHQLHNCSALQKQYEKEKGESGKIHWQHLIQEINVKGSFEGKGKHDVFNRVAHIGDAKQRLSTWREEQASE